VGRWGFSGLGYCAHYPDSVRRSAAFQQHSQPSSLGSRAGGNIARRAQISIRVLSERRGGRRGNKKKKTDEAPPAGSLDPGGLYLCTLPEPGRVPWLTSWTQ